MTALATSPPLEALGRDEVGTMLVTPEHRAWMEALGCVWPAADQEGEWLQHVNSVAALGDTIMSRTAGAQDEICGSSPSQVIVQARCDFIKLFAGLRRDVIERSYYGLAANGLQAVVRPSVFIEAQQFLWNQGIDGCRLVNRTPGAMRLSRPNFAAKLDFWGKLGVDGVATINRTTATIAHAPESLYGRMMPMYAAVRAAGVRDYRTEVHRFVEANPDTLSRKPQFTRILARIIAEHGIDPLGQQSVGSLRRLYRSSAASLVAGSILHQGGLQTLEGLAAATDKCEARGNEILVGLIALHRGTPLVKEYERGYPIGDPEAKIEVYERHKRARWRRKRDWGKDSLPVDWQGPSILGSPELRADQAYQAAVDKDLPGDAELLRREFELLSAREQGDIKRERTMRRALAAISLPWVVKIANECLRRGDPAEKVAIGNLALSRFVIEEYMPGERQWFMGYKEAAIEAIMEVLEPYAPRFDGLSLSDLRSLREKTLAALGG